MDWSPQIVVGAEDDSSVATSVTALKTFNIGFPDHKATVHVIGFSASAFVKSWCTEGGHKMIQHLPSTKRSQLHYEITKRTRLPIALIAGTTVFYDDVSKYSTTKLFGADTLPQWNLTENIINLASVEKTLIFVAKPVQVIAKIEEILKFVSAPIAKESKNSQKWGAQSIVMDGKIYHQTSGIFNMLYQYDSSLMTDFSSKTASKYETVFGGCNIASTMAKLEETGHDTSDYMPFVTAAMNDNWEKVKGYRKVFVDSIS